MSGLISLLSNALGGGLIGAIGSYFSKKEDNKANINSKKLDLAMMQEQNSHEKLMAELQMQGKIDLSEIDAHAKWQQADLTALAKSIEMDKATYSSVDTSKSNKWLVAVDVIRGLMRPTITGGLATYCTFVTAYIFIEHGASLDSTKLSASIFALIDSMAALTGIAVSWWFGSRGHSTHKGV